MINGQKFSPEYWVVHDKKSDDVYISTAHKSKHMSIYIFLNEHAYGRFGCLSDDDVYRIFEEDEDLECILVEIKRC